MDNQNNYNFHNFDPISDQTQSNSNTNQQQPNLNTAFPQNKDQCNPTHIQPQINEASEYENNQQSNVQHSEYPIESHKNTDASVSQFQTQFLKKVKTMENLIHIIKENAYEKHKTELETKLYYKNELENNIEIWKSYIKMNRIQKRNYGNLSKSIWKENERLSNQSDRAIQDQYYVEREIPYQRTEVNKIQRDLIVLSEETKDINNQKLVIEREIMSIEDDIRRLNKLNSDTFAEKENMKSSIKLLKRHSSLIKEKIYFEDNKSDELFSSLTQWATLSRNESEAYDKRTAHFKLFNSLSTTCSTNRNWSNIQKKGSD